jgi:F0F1-type ATP synthase membrane subunit b/b'
MHYQVFFALCICLAFNSKKKIALVISILLILWLFYAFVVPPHAGPFQVRFKSVIGPL